LGYFGIHLLPHFFPMLPSHLTYHGQVAAAPSGMPTSRSSQRPRCRADLGREDAAEGAGPTATSHRPWAMHWSTGRDLSGQIIYSDNICNMMSYKFVCVYEYNISG
jgi:hypothetical protein